MDFFPFLVETLILFLYSLKVNLSIFLLLNEYFDLIIGCFFVVKFESVRFKFSHILIDEFRKLIINFFDVSSKFLIETIDFLWRELQYLFTCMLELGIEIREVFGLCLNVAIFKVGER